MRQGAILATIAHAMWVLGDPILSYELSWDGPNYNRQDSSGTRGTITFMDDDIMGVFRDDNSPRCPWHSKQEYEITPYFLGMPNQLIELAEDQTLQYVVDEYGKYKGPIISSAFWSHDDYLTAAEDWQSVVKHGAHLVHKETMPTTDAVSEWTSQYDFLPHQADLLNLLFQERIQDLKSPMILTDSQRDILFAKGIAGLVESKKLFNAIGIHYE